MCTSNMENGGLLNGVVFIDFRKLLTSSDTNMLLQKLTVYKCDDLTLSWFKSSYRGENNVYSSEELYHQ